MRLAFSPAFVFTMNAIWGVPNCGSALAVVHDRYRIDSFIGSSTAHLPVAAGADLRPRTIGGPPSLPTAICSSDCSRSRTA